MRSTLLAVAMALLLSIMPVSAQTVIGQYQLDIPREPLDAALRDLARQTGLQIARFSDFPHGTVPIVGPVSGKLSVGQALTEILEGTGLVYRVVNEHTIAVVAPGTGSAGPASSSFQRSAALEGGGREANKSSLWNRFLLTQAEGGASASSPAAGQNSAQGLQEVIVTATKKNEPARTIASSVTVQSEPQLDAIGAQSFADYLTGVPGVQFNAWAPGLSTATIRGVSTTGFLDQGQGTTGYFINDVPLTDPNFAVAIPDIDTFDTNNVSVLKGPQGTLFGSASLGGAINYITAPPNLSKLEGRVQGTIAGASVGAGSQSEKIMLNAPLVEDRLAIRGVFVYRDDGGYIDNIGTGVKNSNETLVRGGRFEVLWVPTDGTQINYLFLRQFEATRDLGYQQPAIAGPLEKDTLIAEPYDFKTTINTLRLDQDVGFATLTATAAYHQKSQFTHQDLTSVLGGFFGNQLSPISVGQNGISNGTTFELRLASRAGGRFDYLVGIMHDLTRESFLALFGAPGAEQYATTNLDPILGAGFGQLAVPGNIFWTASSATKGEEEAIFGEGSFHFNDKWMITLGGRAFDTKVTGTISGSGLFEYLISNPHVLNFDFTSPEKATGFTPKASITWNPTSNVMAYVLASKGFRFGGPNVNPPNPMNPFPPTYGPDTLWNYEIGTRTDWFDRTLQVDATVFYIDWREIQVRLSTASGLTYGTNFGEAKSYGIESAVLWRPTGGLALQGSVGYLDATLSQAIQFGPTDEPAGATLPGASKWSLAATVRYDWPSIPLQPTVQLSGRFVSTAPAGFGFVEPVTRGNYSLLDARVTGRYGDVEVATFVNNLADKRGVSNSSYEPGSPFDQYIVRPRTYGLTLDYRF